MFFPDGFLFIHENFRQCLQTPRGWLQWRGLSKPLEPKSPTKSMENEGIMKSTIVSMMAVAGLMMAGSAAALEMPAVVKEGGFQCAGCHQVEKKLVGPSWRDISKFYNGKMEKTPAGKTLKDVLGGKTAEAHLIEKISKGGKGTWGAIPMSPNDASGAKQADVKKLAEFILSIEK